jgi:hypothetical protein
MVSFGNLRPANSGEDKLVLYYDPNVPNEVVIEAVSESSPTAQWNGQGLPPGNIYLMFTGPNNQGTLYLTMAEDKPNASTFMEKWLGSGNQYDSRQVWIPGEFDGPERIFVTLKGNILQASNPNLSSPVIIGAYPEHNTPDPRPKTPGQIWLCSTSK